MRYRARIGLTPYLILILVAFLTFSQNAQADLLLESHAGETDAPDFAGALQLRLGTVKGIRDRAIHDDLVRRYHGALGVTLRYRSLYLIPEFEVQYVEIETTRTEGQLRSAKLRSQGGLEEGEVFKNTSLGVTLGAALPASVLRGFQLLQLGAFVDGRTTLTAPSLTFEELEVVYEGRHLEMKDQGNNGAVEVSYQWWTVTWGGFCTLRMGELPVGRPLSRVLEGSALSVAGGLLHFRLDVDVEIDKSFQAYVPNNQSQRIAKDRPFLRLRYAVPLGKRVGIELGGSTTKQNGDWLYSADGLVSVRF